MPQTCTICKHARREEIDSALLGGEAFRNIAKRYGTSPTALFRHRQNDIPVILAKSKQAAEEVKADTLFERLKALNRETAMILREARQVGSQNNELALRAIARVEKQIELEARLLGELTEETKIALGVTIQQNVEAKLDFSSVTAEELNYAIRIAEKLRGPQPGG